MERKSKYAGAAIALGAALGVVAGVLAGNIGVWLAIGVGIGVGLSAALRPKQSQCPECAAMHRVHGAERRSS